MARFTADVKVVDLDARADLAGDLALLDVRERGRADALVSDVDRRRYLAAHAQLRRWLGEAVGEHPESLVFVNDPCAACGGPHGAPRLRDHDAVGMSLSRSGRYAAMARASDARIGVDLETRRPAADLEPLRADVTAPGETEADLLRAWVRKEAFVKATGEGLVRPLSSVRLAPVRLAPEQLSPKQLSPAQSEVWQSAVWAADGGAKGAVFDIDAGPDLVAALAVVGLDPSRLDPSHDALQFTVETPGFDTVPQ